MVTTAICFILLILLPQGHLLANFGSLPRGKSHESGNGHSIVITFDPKVNGHYNKIDLLIVVEWCLDLKPFDPQYKS